MVWEFKYYINIYLCRYSNTKRVTTIYFLHIFQVSDGPWFQYTENKHWYFYSENEMTWQEAKVSNMHILCNGLCQYVLFSSEICMGQPPFQLHFTFGLMKTFPLSMLFLEFRCV